MKTPGFLETFFSASLLLSGLSIESKAQSEAAALFLTLPPGSRANAMGGAQTAIANDFYALHFNPAGLSRLQKGSAGFYRHKWTFGQLPITFTGAVYTTRYGTFGVGFNNLDIDATTSSGETANSYERAFQLTYAKQVNANVAFGGTVKLVQLKFDQPRDFPDLNANAWGFDFGILVQNILPHWTYSRTSPRFPKKFRRFARPNSFQGLTFGLALLNTGPDRLSVIDESQADPLPQILRLGVAFHAVDTDEVGVLLAMDLDKILVERAPDGQPDSFMKSWFTAWDNGFDNFRFGAEIEIYHIFAVRFGRDEFLTFSRNNGVSEWTFGVGLGPEWARLNLVRRSFPTAARNDKWVVDFAIAY